MPTNIPDRRPFPAAPCRPIRRRMTGTRAHRDVVSFAHGLELVSVQLRRPHQPRQNLARGVHLVCHHLFVHDDIHVGRCRHPPCFGRHFPICVHQDDTLGVLSAWVSPARHLRLAVCRDRDQAASRPRQERLLVAPFFIAPSLLNKLSDWLDNPLLATVVSALALGLSVWCFVELFCLRGTKGPNGFGPDPLAPVAPVAPVDTRPRWDQQSELEFVPHSAGPSAGAHVKRSHD